MSPRPRRVNDAFILLPEKPVLTATALKHLTNVSIALSSERDHEKLLKVILRNAMDLANADAGSLYLVSREPSPCLRFVLALNDSVSLPFKAAEIPLDSSSLAGFVALSGEILNLDDVYQLRADAPYQFNKAFDEQAGYVTRSMLVVPMTNHRGDITGVLQLINRKRADAHDITSTTRADAFILPFEPDLVELLRGVASMAAVAIENNKLMQDIQDLFEGFVNASVTAIEQRDPTTSGHSARVAEMTVGLAELVDGLSDGPFREVRFTSDELRTIRYASILHDFGKVGVRENVLVKAKKLYPPDLDRILARLETARLYQERAILRRKIELFEAGVKKDDERLAHLEAELLLQMAHIDDFKSLVLKSNEPSVLPDGDFTTLQKIAQTSFRDHEGQDRLLLEPFELNMLSIRKGTLTEDERVEIESHVTNTYNFLSKIPWTAELRDVPEIAYHHHEKLNGRGYPRKVSVIPVPSRMMTVADIFDALSASDRPYKKAVPIDKSLDILQMEVKDGMLDAELVRLFIDAKIYEKARNVSS